MSDEDVRRVMDKMNAFWNHMERPLRILEYVLLIALGIWLGRTFK